MALWKLLAAELWILIRENKDPEKTLELIKKTLRKYRRYEIFWG